MRHESAFIVTGIIRTVCWQAVLAFILVVGLELFERRVLMPVGIFQKYLITYIRLDSSTYTNILSTLAQISGVFLGLYFTAISIVASTIYARLQRDIRDLLMREKVGNQYIRVVALLGGVTIISLAACALGVKLGFLNLLLVTLTGVVAIFSFVVLGMRAFYFFDPTALVDYLARDLLRSIHGSTLKGFQWRDSSFQDHYRRQADDLLKTYINVVHLASSEEHLRGRPLTELVLRALALLELYAQEKRGIPTDSYWFRRIRRHRNWLVSDYTQIDIALRTGTALQPEIVPDQMWFESNIEQIVTKTMEALLKQNELSNSITIIDSLQRTLALLGERLAIEEALHLFKAVKPLVQAKIHKWSLTVGSSEQEVEQLALALALTDSIGIGLINTLLGFSKRLDKITSESFGNGIDKIAWGKAKEIYTIDMPRDVIAQLEYLNKGLEFERKLEDRAISPPWYQKQIAALGFVRFLSGAVGDLVKELEGTFANECDTLVQEKRYVFAAQLIQRGLESCNKFLVHIGEAKACYDRINLLRKVEDIPWPSIDWENLDRRIRNVQERLVVAFGQSSNALAALPKSKYLPDYFGQAYSVLAEECYKSMATGNEALFQKIFPSFFAASWSAYNLLLQELGDRDERTKIVFSSEPIVDLLELSGYALIYTELGGKQFWNMVKELWDNYLSSITAPQAISKFLMAVVEYRSSLFAILPRDLGRTSWKQDLTRRLEEQGLLDDRSAHPFLRKKRTTTKHSIAIIRALTRSRYVFEDPQDIFLALYLLPRPEAAGCEMPRRAESFNRTFQREQASNSLNENEIL